MTRVSRRRVTRCRPGLDQHLALLAATLLAVGLLACTPRLPSSPQPDSGSPEMVGEADRIPATGQPAPELAPIDQAMASLLARWEVPGGALAISRGGRLVVARGYGWADLERHEPVRPDSLFRIASLSKPLTAVTALRLAEAGRLDLDARVVELLAPSRAPTDPRVREITLRQLLQHASGLPPGPPSCVDDLEILLSQPLTSPPGTTQEYSSLGYCLAGRVLERVSGQPYEQLVHQTLLRPLGISRMRLAHSLPDQRVEGEVRYYDLAEAGLVPAIVPGQTGLVPRPYGGLYLEAKGPEGGWLASTVDLLRFVTALDGSRPPRLLQADTLRAMVARPAAAGSSSDVYYGLGWQVLPVKDGAHWWIGGGFPGTASLLYRYADGVAWVALFNRLPEPRDGETFHEAVEQTLRKARDAVASGPERDGFKS